LNTGPWTDGASSRGQVSGSRPPPGSERKPGARIEPPLGRARSAQNFGRLFPHLPAFAEASPALDAALRELGRPGGLMDAHDALERGPVDLIVDPALSVNNPTHTAGTTFMGQFMDHDMTFDATSFLGVPTPPESAPNARTPGFDLDSVYGAGPAGSPHLYDGIRLRVESSGRFEDVPRTQTARRSSPTRATTST
jgi:hypothetical protein